MKLLHNKKVGALLRCFSTNPELVERTVSLALASIERMLSVHVDKMQFVSRIEVLVPMDPAYAEMDCDQTAPRLRTAIKEAGWKNVFVSEVRHGDIFCSILNYGMWRLSSAGCAKALILSKEAEQYFAPEAAEDLVISAEKGARVSGIALKELTESIMQGRIANTFAMWDIPSLMQVSLFDLRNAKPAKEAANKDRSEAWHSGKCFWVYDRAGVEEIIPLIRLIRMFGPCIAPILPRGAGVKVWQAPDPIIDPEGYVRHENKLGTKFVRQSYFASLEHADLSFLQGGVMPDYRHLNYIK